MGASTVANGSGTAIETRLESGACSRKGVSKQAQTTPLPLYGTKDTLKGTRKPVQHPTFQSVTTQMSSVT